MRRRSPTPLVVTAITFAALAALAAACAAPPVAAPESTTTTAAPVATVTTAAVTTSTATPSTTSTPTTAAAPTTTTTVPLAGIPTRPFAPTSIWRRPIDPGARYVDVSDMTGAAAEHISRVGTDLVTLCETDPASPLVEIRRSLGWSMPDRATSGPVVAYQRNLAPDACADVNWNPIGNGLFVLYDPAAKTADLGIGGWRVADGGPLLTSGNDGRSAHGLDVAGGDGLVGYGRASGLPALGGLLRPGELTEGIDHPLAVNLSASLLSLGHTWPARSEDSTASLTYKGTNPALTMGTLLAVPATVDLDGLTWRTPQGRVLAIAAQRYGWYVVDVHLTPGLVQLGMSTDAARADLGLQISDGGRSQRVDPAEIDGNGFVADVQQVFALLQAVPQSG